MFTMKWHYRFMELAKLVATWSKDTSTKTGAVIVGPDKEIRATGYNGFVRGVDDDVFERFERPTVYNACLCGTCVKGCVLYATHFPCTDCTRAIIQSGIKLVVTNPLVIDKNTPHNTWRDRITYSEQMLKEAGVELMILPPQE